MKYSRLLSNGAMVALCCAALCRPAGADVKYSETMKILAGPGSQAAGSAHGDGPVAGPGAGAMGAMGAMGNGTTTYIKDGAERVETAMQYGPVKMNDVTITVCASRKIYHLDPALKIYTTAPLHEDNADHTPSAPAHADATPPPQKKGHGKITTSYNMKFIGNETVAGRKCRHYAVDMSMKMEGCAGNGEMAIKNEIWVTDYKMPVFNCDDEPYRRGIPMPPTHGACDITFERKGDVSGMAEAYRGLVVKTKTITNMPGRDGQAGGQMIMVRELTSLSDAKLSDDWFTVPADFRLVSDDEFQKARSRAMMHSIMSGMGSQQASTGDDGDDAGDSDANKTHRPKMPRFKLPF